MRPENDNKPPRKELWEIYKEVNDALWAAAGYPNGYRVPTNPQTYKDKGESL